MVATQTCSDSHSLFQQSSEEWDAPFTGKQPFSSYPQSPQETETQQSQHHNTSRYHDHSNSSPSRYEALSLPQVSASKLRGKKNRSKTWQLHKLKNERTLLQTNELLQQMKHLEKSLKSKPNNNNTPTKNKKKEDVQSEESNVSNAVPVVRNEPSQTLSVESIVIIPPPKKDLVIQKLEEMEQQFLTEGDQNPSEGSKSIRSSDHIALEQWKHAVKERVQRNALAASAQSPPRPSPLGCTTATNKPTTTCHTLQSARSLSVAMEELQCQSKTIGTDQATRTCLGSYTLGSYTLPSPTSTTSLPRPTVQVVSQTLKLQSTNMGDDQASRTSSLESYTLPTDASRINYPSPRMRSTTAPLPLSPRPHLRALTPKNIDVRSRPPPVTPKAIKLNKMVTRNQEEREEGQTKLPQQQQQDEKRDALIADSLVHRSQASTQLPHQKLHERTEQKIAQRISSFRRSLVPLQQHQKFSELGLKTIQEARQKRLQLLHRRQQDAQMTYLAEQRKRMAKLSTSSPAKGTPPGKLQHFFVLVKDK